MIQHYFANFLRDELVYRQVERFWLDLWQRIDPDERGRNRWTTPWFAPLPPSISEGNPIFSAVSPALRRGIRILQYEPTEEGVEFFAYPDTFGGSPLAPDTINELVISCALSNVSAHHAEKLLRPWVTGELISYDSGGDEVRPYLPPDYPGSWASNVAA